MKLTHSLALTLPLASSWALGADLTVKFELPQLNVAEYHKPYVAIWIEGPDRGVASTLAVLYDVRKRDNRGARYLKDLRTFWRTAGEGMTLPMDGVSGATRAPGVHTMNFPAARNKLDTLPPGDYKLVIEAAREAGGRELVRLPFHWQPGSTVASASGGKEELGAVSLAIQ